MFRLLCMTIPSFALLIGLGCSAQRESPFAEWIDESDASINAELARWQREQRQERRGGTAQADPNGPPVLELPEDLTVDSLVDLALERNPAIRVAEQRIRRLANRIPQVTSLSDPMLQVAPFGEMAETAAGQVDVMTGLSQRFPLGGKLAARGRVAEQEVAEALQQLEETRLDVIADTRVAWWSYYFATRAIEVTERNRDLVDQFHDDADAKFRAGTATQEDVLRASVEMSNLDNELLALRQRQTTARAMLNRMIDRPVDAPIPAPALREIEQIEQALDVLIAEAMEIHPSLQRIRERIEGFRYRHELAKLDRIPDLTVSLSYNFVDDEGLSGVANGDDQWWVGFGVNLPIWSQRLDAAEREALRGRLENIASLKNETNRLEFRIQDALVNAQTHQGQAELFRDTIVPQAEQTVEASLSSYRAGRASFLTLIDNWRKLLTFQLTYHHHLAQLEQSVAELERAVGGDLDRKKGDGAPPSVDDGEPSEEPEVD